MMSQYNFNQPQDAEHFLRSQGFRPIRATVWVHDKATATIHDEGLRLVVVNKQVREKA